MFLHFRNIVNEGGVKRGMAAQVFGSSWMSILSERLLDSYLVTAVPKLTRQMRHFRLDKKLLVWYKSGSTTKTVVYLE